jgi:hypothetical protein
VLIYTKDTAPALRRGLLGSWGNYFLFDYQGLSVIENVAVLREAGLDACLYRVEAVDLVDNGHQQVEAGKSRQQ